MTAPDGKFRKRERILKSKDFRTVYKEGLSVKSGPLVLCCMPNSLGYSRIGFSIGARNVKLASARNRIKRLFREAYRRNRLRISKPCDLVLIARRALPEKAGLADAEAAFMKLIKAAGIAI